MACVADDRISPGMRHMKKREIIHNTKDIIKFLSVALGERTLRKYDNLLGAAGYIRKHFSMFGALPWEEMYAVDGKQVANLIVEIPGNEDADSIIVIGAHYDTIEDTPGADDNASGIAGLLELYRLLGTRRYKKTLRFVAFTLEEPPYFSSDEMGSMVNAKRCRERNEKIELMICLEMIGYAHRRYQQHVPFRDMSKKLPARGDFLAVVSLPSCCGHAYGWKNIYNRHARHEIVDIVGPSSIPGISHSDHYSFNRHGFPAIMLTDTALYRNRNYHTDGDTYETINFEFLAEHIVNMHRTIEEIADMDIMLDKNSPRSLAICR